jgi:hypothetical protein
MFEAKHRTATATATATVAKTLRASDEKKTTPVQTEAQRGACQVRNCSFRQVP